jgi:hypothetical protein
MGGSSKQTVGYRYFMGLHFALCYGPVDAIKRILVGDREAWSGNVDRNSVINIDKPSLFGGDDREGGVVGDLSVLMGASNQEKDGYLASQLGSDIPHFRGVLTAAYRGGQVSSNNPYVKPWAFEVKRIKTGWECLPAGGDMELEFRNETIDSWIQGEDPRSCLNDHEYWDGSQWVESYQDAFDALQANYEYPLTPSPIGWGLDSADATGQTRLISPYDVPGPNPGDRQQVRMHFQYQALWALVPSSKKFGRLDDNSGFGNNIFKQLFDADVQPGQYVWWSGLVGGGLTAGAIYFIRTNAPWNPPVPASEWSLLNNCVESLGCPYDEDLVPSVWRIEDPTMLVRRKPKPPSNLCFPMCADEKPADPSDSNFCLLDGKSGRSLEFLRQLPEKYNTGISWKALYNYRTASSSLRAAIAEYLGDSPPPCLPVGHPVDTQEVWEGVYNRWVNAGLIAPGLTYGVDYPLTITFVQYKALQEYLANSGATPIRRPLEPIIPDFHHRYNDEDWWTGHYNEAVAQGLMAAGREYNGVSGGYPEEQSFIYYRALAVAGIGADGWYPDKAEVGDGDMNPAHIIYQSIVDSNWGMGYPVAQIDDADFRSAADAMFSEGMGLSLLWNAQDEIGTFIRLVLDHCAGILYSDPRTGKFRLKLIRDDYDPETLQVFDQSNIVSLEAWQRVGYGDTINEITVVYEDRETGKDAGITVQDLANIQVQGVVSQTRQYPGISNASLAARVAERDLMAASVPLAKGQMIVNREAWDLIPGDVFKLSWPKLGLSESICRVLKVDTGNLNDRQIRIDFSEDVYGLPASSYSQQQPGGWVEPDTQPNVVVAQTALEAPYYLLAQSLSAADLDYLDDDSGYFLTLAADPGGAATGYNIFSRVDPADFEQTGVGEFSASGTLVGELSISETTIEIEGVTGLADLTVGALAQIGVGASAELVQITSVSGTTLGIARGMLDTTPRAHDSGQRFWQIDVFGEDATERASNEEVDFKLPAVGTGGQIDLDSATDFSATAAARQIRPYPPGQVLIGTFDYPTEITEPFTVYWAHRDRTLQTAYLVQQAEDSIGPEAGTTYNVFAYDDDTGTLLDSSTGLAGTSWTPALGGAYNLRIEIESERDGHTSWQRQVRTFTYSAEGRLTESGETRITESGDIRSQE